MNFKRILTTAALALLPLAANAATLIIPAAGTGAGANDSRWQTELTLHNAGSKPIPLSLYFHDAQGRSNASALTLASRSTVSIADIVHTTFGHENITGALTIEATDSDARRLAVTSRTFNVSEAGEFGQDIPAVNADAAAEAGDTAVLAGPSDAIANRFNFGLFAAADATVRWQLVRKDGSLGGTSDLSYQKNTQVQYAGGAGALFGATGEDNDVIHATVLSGSAVFYGSAVNNATGDPTYVPSILTTEEIRIQFAGIDLDENGTIDVADADRDGIVDSPVEIFASLFPNFFRVVATGENGEKLQLALISTPADAVFTDDNGTLQVAATTNLRGTTGEIKVRATSGSTTQVLTIPVFFR
jgi:hypothetical protein